MRVMTFSRTFPKTHPKSGQSTHFIERIWAGLAEMGIVDFEAPATQKEYFNDCPVDFHTYYTSKPKYHTIRAGYRWKVGDMFSPRVWSGVPYRSRQIVFGPPIQVEKIWPFQIKDGSTLYIDHWDKGIMSMSNTNLVQLAWNDGLHPQDFIDWFSLQPKKKGPEFSGQIICWNPTLEY